MLLIRRATRSLSAAPQRSLSSYLNDTKIPTDHFQDSLPKLPVPKLDDTLRRYLYFAAPMVDEDALRRTKAAVDTFGSNEGKSLQAELTSRNAARYSSYISRPWFDMYLDGRDSLMINSNPQLTFKDDPDPMKRQQAARAASLVAASVSFYRTLRDGRLEPDVFHTKPARTKTQMWESAVRLLPRSVASYGAILAGAYPLDMSQYANLFASTRVPREGRDELVRYAEADSRHIVVQRGAQFFPITVLTECGDAVPQAELQAAFEAVLATSPSNPDDAVPLGALTSLPRSDWAAAREELISSSAVNAASLRVVDSALFAVCLEHSEPEEIRDVGRCMLHGDARNRWFDKSFQLIVAANGTSAVNFEHAWGDGVAVIRYLTEVWKAAKASSVPSRAAVTAAAAAAPVPAQLRWELSSATRETVATAERKADAFIARIENEFLETDVVTKPSLRALGLSPDGFLQMAFQLAHQRMHGHTPATYESASTAAFKHGRTETIRSATPEAASFARVCCDAGTGAGERNAAMRAAIKRHGAITKDALMGKGIDRHLFALRALAMESGATPAIFEDETYQVMNKWILSTSTLAELEALSNGGFGPVNEECYGIGYDIHAEGCRFGVSSYYKGSGEFLRHLEGALRDMRTAAESTST